MFTKVSKFQNKFVTLCCCICMLLAWGLPVTVQAADVSWALAQSTSVSSAQPGDVVEVSVSIQGISTPVDAVQVSGTIEFDSNLFTLQQIVGNELSTAKVNATSGRFTLANGLGKTINSGALLFTAMMKVNDNAPVGKTTVCVDAVSITDKNGDVSSLSNFTPSTINLVTGGDGQVSDSEESIDVDDGVSEDIEEDEVDVDIEEDEEDEEFDVDDFDDVDDYISIEKKDKQKQPSKAKVTATTLKKNVGSISRTERKKTPVASSTDVDENYKTGAGLGNDLYLVVALIMGMSGLGLVFIRRKVLKNKIYF